MLIADCPNKVLLALIDQFIHRTRRYEIALMREGRNVAVATNNHQEVMHALADGDLAGGCAALRNNLQTGFAPIAAWLAERKLKEGSDDQNVGAGRSRPCCSCRRARRDRGADAAGRDPLIGLWAYEPISARRCAARSPSAGRDAAGARPSPVARSPARRRRRHPLRIRRGTAPFAAGSSRDRRTIEGFWLQPSGETEDRRDPGGSGQRFATRTVLRRAGAGRWRGTVTPLDDRFTLYLSIFRDDRTAPSPARSAIPELNSNGGASRFRVEPRGRRRPASTSATRAARSVMTRLPAVARPDQDPLARSRPRDRADSPRAGRGRRLLPAPARRRRPTSIARRPKPATAGGRPAARERGIDEAALTARRPGDIIASDPTARPPSLIHSLLVAYRGRLVLEEYFFGYDRDTPHDTRSAGKTFASVMLGAAMMHGVAIAPDTPIYALLAGMWARSPIPTRARRRSRSRI